MAVSDIAVQIGHRNRRRLATGAIVLAAIAAIAVWRGTSGSLLTGSGNHAASGVHYRVLRTVVDKLTYGMSKQQVLHRIGRPEKIAGSCWQYPVNVKNFVGQLINAERVCFISNAYSNSYEELDGKWRDPRSTRIVIPPPTQ